jgi:peptide/nickel transport system substrate-binding protein
MMRRARRASTSIAHVALLLGASRSGVLMLAALACGAPERRQSTVVYASGADLESANPLVTIHPLSRQVQRYALFVTLARYDSALAPIPYLARRWSWSADRRTLTLELETGLRWHDGAPTTARDVVFTLDAARDPATGYPRYADLASIAEVTAANDSTVRVTFVSAPPAFPAVFCELPVLPAHLLGSVPRADMRRASFNHAPVGNGPFRFRSRDAGQRWVFERAPDFPPSLGGPARIERLVVAVVDEPTTKYAGLVSGELDVAGISPTMASLAASDSMIRVVSYPVLFANAIVFNAARPPFDDARVRRAVDAALDRRRIIDAALAGFAAPAAGPVPPDNPLAIEAEPRAAPALADSLLDAAGWRPGPRGTRQRAGRELAFTLLTVGSGDNAVEQLVQADLREHGIRMEIRQLELGAFLAQARAPTKSFDALITGVSGDLSLSYLAAMYDSRLAGGVLDYGGYHTPRLDSAFAAVRGATSARALGDAWRSVQLVLRDEMPAAWIYHSKGVQGVSGRLRGVTMDLRGEMATLPDWYVSTSAAGAP